MITRLYDEFPKEFLDYDIFATKIECDFYAYSQFDFAQFFKITNGQTVTGVLSLIDGFMCISNKNSETEQLKQFITLLNPIGIMCESTLADRLNLTGKNLFIMERRKEGIDYSDFSEVSSATAVFNELNSFAKDELSLPKRDSFISDFSFKQRRNLSMAVSNGKAIAVAFANGKFSAYIGAVATDKAFRQNHFGTKAVEALIFRLKKDTVYLFCEQSNLPFYQKLSFKVKAKATVFNMGE